MIRISLLLLLLLSTGVQAAKGVAVSVSPQASQIGEQIMAQGGNGVDAAVAVGFALAVTWPEAGNIGGGGFMLIRPADAKSPPIVVDYREKAPLAATKDLFVKHGMKPHLTVGVPGAVAGMYLAHQKFGKLPWKDLVMPAVNLAKEGFPIDAALADSLNRNLSLPRAKPFAELHRVYGKPDGTKWLKGEKLRLPELAATLQRIAEKGKEGFYKGPTAELLAKEMKLGKGLITLEDLAGYEAKLRKSIHGTFRGCDICGATPPSSGGTCLIEMLNILENFDLKKHPRFSSETLHLMAETMRRVYRDRAQYLGDQDFVKIPAHLTTKEYARKLAKEIQLAKATPSADLAKEIPLADEKPNTTHYSVIDGAGMAVSTTTTLENSFGSMVVVRGAGFLLNNEMTDFNPKPGITTRTGIIGTEPNQIAPGKRMLSSMSPTIVVKDGKPILITGSPGGRTIINTVLCVVVNVVEYQMPLRDALAAPRMHMQWFPDRIQMEASLFAKYPDAIKEMQKRGHQIMRIRSQGDAHSIWWNPKTRTYEGEMDHRRAGRPAAFKEK